MTSRSESGNGSTVPGSYSTTWDYDTLAGSACGVKGVGKLCRVTGSGATRDFRYDKFSRPMSSKLTVAGESTPWESFSAYDAMSRVNETVVYDSLNRLKEVKQGATTVRSFGYDGLGNLTSKSDVGSYGYVANTHRVASAGGNSYSYLGSGMLTQVTGPGATTIVPTPFLLPASITKGANVLAYLYDGDHRRVREDRTGANAGRTIHVLNGDAAFFEEETTAAGMQKYRHFISTPEGVAEVVEKTASATSVKGMHRDHLGSTIAVTDEAGTAPMGVSPWGERRDSRAA